VIGIRRAGPNCLLVNDSPIVFSKADADWLAIRVIIVNPRNFDTFYGKFHLELEKERLIDEQSRAAMNKVCKVNKGELRWSAVCCVGGLFAT